MISNLKTKTIFLISFFLVWSCYHLNESPNINQPSAFTFYNMALQNQLAGNLETALQQVTRAIKINDHISLFYVLKAQLFDSLHMIDSAIVYYQKSLFYRSHSPEVLRRLGELFEQKGRFPQAVNYFHKAYLENPENTTLLLKIVNIYLHEEDIVKAKEFLREYRQKQELKALKLDPLYFVYLAKVAIAQGDSLNAARYYALSHCGSCLTPKRAEWVFAILLKDGDLNSYFELLSSLSRNRQFPQNLLFYYRGKYYQALGNVHDALEQFERAYQNGLRKPDLIKTLIQFYEKQNKPKKVNKLKSKLKSYFHSNRNTFGKNDLDISIPH